MTNERLELVINTVINETTIVQYGILLDSTPKRGYKQWSDEFFKKLTIISISKSPTHNVDRSHIWNPPRPFKEMEGDAVWATQETLKLIEGNWAAKWAHVAHLEATQDFSTSESAKALLQKPIETRLALISRMDEEEMGKNWCSVHWFVALQQLTFLRRLLLAHLSLDLNFRCSLLLVRRRRWVSGRSILQCHRPLHLCWLQPVILLLSHLTADLVPLSHINSWTHCWACSYAGSRRKQQWYALVSFLPIRAAHGKTRILKKSNAQMIEQFKAVIQIIEIAKAWERHRLHGSSCGVACAGAFSQPFWWTLQAILGTGVAVP